MKTIVGKLILLLSFSACININLHAQNSKRTDSTKHPSVYRMNYWVSGAITLAGGVSNYVGIPPIMDKAEITAAEMQSVNRNVGSFNQWALNQDPSKIGMYNSAADITLISCVVAPGILAFDKNIRQEWGKMLLMYLETIAVVSNVYTWSPLGPKFNDKFRPVVYYDAISVADRNDGNNRNSFYSGHTASAAAATFFMAKVYTDYHPELGGKKYLFYAAAAVPPLVLGYFRVKSLRHFPSDVAVGFGVGALCGILIPELHRIKLKNKDMSLGLATTGGSTGLALTWKPGSSGRHINTSF